MSAYFNELDPFPATWLQNLYPVAAVDERSIVDVQPADLAGYSRAHFFAGIGGWELALSLAGWPEDRPVWTGSCPCQPFSAAGKRGGGSDARHLWPEFHRLIAECRPPTVFGEQVASADGRAWLSAVRADLEALGYAVGAADLCAAGVGAPHIRQRLYWVAKSGGAGLQERGGQDAERSPAAACGDGHRGDVWLADTGRGGLQRGRRPGSPRGALGRLEGDSQQRQRGGPDARNCRGADGLANSCGRHASPEREQRGRQHGQQSADGGVGFGMADTQDSDGWGAVGAANDGGWIAQAGGPGRGNHWADVEWLPCADGKARPTQPGLCPLAHGVPGRMGKLRAYGNAIVPQVAAEFIAAFLEAEVMA